MKKDALHMNPQRLFNLRFNVFSFCLQYNDGTYQAAEDKAFDLFSKWFYSLWD